MSHFSLPRFNEALKRRVPRYTSYPPATSFTPAVGKTRQAAWLGALVPGEAVSAYFHIPFCRRLCWFCACRTQGITTDAPLLPYVTGLINEIELVAKHLPPGIRLSRLHFGGGTPTVLQPELLKDLAFEIARVMPMAPHAEISVEIDPTVLDEVRLDALADIGVNRASIGVQDFAPKVQRAIGRQQGAALTAAAVKGLRARGINDLNLDILYGLPHQSEESLAQTVQTCIDMNPDRIALYGYAHVPWAAKRQVMIDDAELPDGPERLRLYDLAASLFQMAGYTALGIDHFAKPSDPLAKAAANGRMRRNFQGYTDDQAETLLGFGASSISTFHEGYVQNVARTADYLSTVTSGELAGTRGYALGQDERLDAALIEAVLCDLQVDPVAIANRMERDPAVIAERLRAVAKSWPNMVRQTDNGGIRIPEAGRPFARIIAAELDRMESAGRHSLAV